MTRMSSENNKDEDEKNCVLSSSRYKHSTYNKKHLSFFVSSRSSIESVKKLNLLTIATIKRREQEEENEAIQWELLLSSSN